MTSIGNSYTADIYCSNADSTSASTYYRRLNYAADDWTTYQSLCHYENNFTGAVITYYNKGEIVGEEQYEFDEENNKIIEEIRKDLQKTKKEYAKKAVYRLTDVEVDDEEDVKQIEAAIVQREVDKITNWETRKYESSSGA